MVRERPLDRLGDANLSVLRNLHRIASPDARQ
jgi:hypothetical protein